MAGRQVRAICFRRLIHRAIAAVSGSREPGQVDRSVAGRTLVFPGADRSVIAEVTARLARRAVSAVAVC